MDQELKDAVLRGLTATAFSAVLMYLGLRTWMTMTVSLGPVDTLYALVDTATVLAGVTAFLTTTVASYTAGMMRCKKYFEEGKYRIGRYFRSFRQCVLLRDGTS